MKYSITTEGRLCCCGDEDERFRDATEAEVKAFVKDNPEYAVEDGCIVENRAHYEARAKKK